MKGLRKVISQNKYQIVHIHQNSASMTMDAFVAKTCGTKTIIGHSHNTKCNVLWQHYFFRPFVNQFISYRFACSIDAGKWVFGKNRKDIKIINNAVDQSKWSFNEEIRKKNGYPGIENRHTIGFVGRLYDGQKNLFRLIDIFSEFCSLDTQAHLLIVGDGPDRVKLQTYIKEKNMIEKVSFLGNIDNVNEIMMCMDVFLFPSRFEGLGLVVIEAQASGLPCIISDRVPAPDLVGNLTILSLDDTNETWANELNKAMQKPVSRNVSDKIITGGYDISYEAKKLQEFYLSL